MLLNTVNRANKNAIDPFTDISFLDIVKAKLISKLVL